MSKVLVLGSAGMAGSIISKFLSSYHDVTSFDRRHFDCLKDKIPALDKYDCVINCIGKIKQKESSIDDYYKINSEFPKELCKKTNKLIHISSDCVFSGKLSISKAYYSKDHPDADDDYGKSKALGEFPDESMVLRTSIIGPSKDNAGLFEWFKNNNSAEIPGYINHIWSGITTLELAKIINAILNENKYKHGLYQIASNKLSKYDLLTQINETFDLDKNIIPYFDINYINRSLLSDIQCQNIKQQLLELKEFKI
jgi:dTDP-4-dehydrorhamnose reductase